MSHKKLFMFVAALLPVTALHAQNDTQPRPAPVATSKVAAPSDAILATWLHVGSTNEVSLAQVALKQAQHADVRAFAQKMIDDHKAFAAKLQPLTTASGAGVGKDGKDSSGDRNKDGSGERGKAEQGEGTNPHSNPQTPADASSARGHMPGGFDHSALIRDLGKKCLQSETKMLSSKTGAEFDRSYMAMTVASHVRSADMLEVFKTYASTNLLPTLEEGQKTVSAHLEHAKNLCKQVDEVAISGNSAGGKSPRDDR